jgi:membrane-bound toxin of toxin-antitoxin system
MQLPLAVVWERSRLLLAVLVLAYAAACSGVVLSGLLWPWQIAALLVLVLGFYWSLRQWRNSGGALEVFGPGEAVLRDEGARIRVVAVRRVVWPWLVAVDLRDLDGRSAGRSRRIVVVADALDPDVFRRLRLCLRVGLLRPVADPE